MSKKIWSNFDVQHGVVMHPWCILSQIQLNFKTALSLHKFISKESSMKTKIWPTKNEIKRCKKDSTFNGKHLSGKQKVRRAQTWLEEQWPTLKSIPCHRTMLIKASLPYNLLPPPSFCKFPPNTNTRFIPRLQTLSSCWRRHPLWPMYKRGTPPQPTQTAESNTNYQS